MLLTILLAALQALPSPTAATTPSDFRPYVRGVAASAKCQPATVRHAEGGEPLRPRRFNELPSGRLELAVFRQFDNCPIPAVVREGIGGAPAVRGTLESERR
jgi:hypothetical protein